MTWQNDCNSQSATAQLPSLLAVLRSHEANCRAVLIGDLGRVLTLSLAAWCRLRHLPVIFCSDATLNEPGNRRLPWVDWMLKTAHSRVFDAVFTTGTLAFQALRSRGVPPERIATSLYPVDLVAWRERARTKLTQARAFRDTLGADKVFLSLCGPNQAEDWRLILQAFALVARDRPTARIVMIGDGLKREARSTLEALAIADKVTVVGWGSNDDLARFYLASDVLVHAPAPERWGMTVSNAMACGLTVAATTSVAAAADLVVPGRTGALAWPTDPVSLAEAMVASATLAGQPVTQAAIRLVLERTGADAAAANLERLLDSLSTEAQWPTWLTLIRDEARNVHGRWAL